MSILGRIATTGRMPAEMPWIPLRDSVVFPEAITEISVGRSASIAAVGAADSGEGWLAVFAQRGAETDEPRRADLYAVGCAARVLSIEPLPDGVPGVNVRLQPVTRVKLVELLEGEAASVRVERLPESNDTIDALTRQAVEAFCVGAIRHVHGWSKAEAERYVKALATSARLAWLGAAYLELDVPTLQSLLESDDVHANIERILTCKDELGPGDPPVSWWRRLLRAIFG